VDPDTWNPVQELLPANFNFRGLLSQIKGSGIVDIDSCQHGAVIFGRPESSRLTWPDMGDPTSMELVAASSTRSIEDSQMQWVGASSDGSSSSARVSTEKMEGSDGQDTPMTSPVGSLSRSRSGQSSTLSGSGVAPVSMSSSQPSLEEDPNNGTGAEPSAPGAEHGIGPGRTAKKRTTSEMEGDEPLQGGISKKLKAFSLTAGFHRGRRGAPAKIKGQE